MKKVLFLLTSSFPFGRGESFIANELPYLESAFDEISIISNDTEHDITFSLPPSVECRRMGYALTRWETALSLFGFLGGAVWEELKVVRDQYRLPWTKGVLSTVLVSWWKGRRFSRAIRDLAGKHRGAEVHLYSFWANDMAVAAAISRQKGWVHRAYCRAHGWDVYFERARVGFLPFRRYLAANLDHLLFASEDGRRYFETRVGGQELGSLGHARLGTPPVSPRPMGRISPFTIISCSSMIPLKRIQLIVEALRLVAGKARWVHFGDGPTRSAVERSCAELPSRIDVELKGHIPHTDVLSGLLELRPSVFLNVSETEGLPVSMMEAMSVGIPVVGTGVGGVREIIEHQVNGLLLDPDPAPAQVASAIDAISELSEEEYMKLAGRAWATWHDKFNAEENYPSFLELIGIKAGEEKSN